jgi:hypothetical protein
VRQQLFFDIFMGGCVLEVELEIKLIDSDGFFSGIVLKGTSQESLWEEES